MVKLWHIILGTWRALTGYKTDETYRRRLICKNCKHRIKFSGVFICDLCGCVIKSKTAVPNEKCLMKLW